jgi:hypothetical protein
MHKSHLGRAPGVFLRMKHDARIKVQAAVLASIEKGMPYQSACWSAEVDPEEFQQAVDKDPRLAAAIQIRRARLESKLLADVAKGGRGLSTSKAALEILGRSFQTWAPKSNATLAKQFEDALSDLEKILEPDVFEKIVRAFERHS